VYCGPKDEKIQRKEMARVREVRNQRIASLGNVRTKSALDSGTIGTHEHTSDAIVWC